MTQEHEWMTVKEVAAYLRISRDQVYRMAKDGRLPASKKVGHWRFSRQRLDEWMEGRTPVASGER